MYQHRLVNAASLLLILLCFTPAVAQNQPPNAVPAKTVSSQKADDAKEKERREKERKEVEEKKRQEAQEAAKAKEGRARKEEERKAQDRKERERKEEAVRQGEQRRKEEDRRREEDRRKEDARKTEEQKRKEEEIRLEVEKRRQVEMEERRRERERERRVRPRPSEITYYHPAYQHIERETVVIIAPQQIDNSPVVQTEPIIAVAAATAPAVTATPAAAPAAEPGPTVAALPPSSHRYYQERETPRSYVSVLMAPGQGDRKTAIGLQFLSNKNFGLGLWFSGSFGRDNEVIDATIPHDDYYTQSRTGTYGVQALCGVGSETAMLIFGAGLSVEQTSYTDVSNATGWKWNGGETTTTKPAALVGCRFRLGGRVSLQLGYDTSHFGFFGLSAGF